MQEHISSPDAALGPDVGQGAFRVCKGIYLKLAPKHGWRQQDAYDADEKPSQHPALDGRVVLLQRTWPRSASTWQLSAAQLCVSPAPRLLVSLTRHCQITLGTQEAVKRLACHAQATLLACAEAIA